MKLIHALFVGAALIGALYVFHMYTAHQGSQILPGVGLPNV
jgi:hypothetical protein